MPTAIYPTNCYIDGLRMMAWEAAGWAVRNRGGQIEVWGPASIAASIDRDICQMAGCLDAPAH